MRLVARYAAKSDVGLVRSNNEDSYLASPPLFAVADGMGGHKGGEVASAGAIRTLAAQAGHDDESLLAAVQAANQAVFAEAGANPGLAGMGTTITAMLVAGNSVQIVHVGDSRAYLLRDRGLRRLTQDHTVVERLAREGKIAPGDVDHHPQRSVLERALGVSPDVDIDVRLIDVRAGDRMLLCTDGLTSMVSDDEIRAILEVESDPDGAADRLVQGALGAGGKDNVTALVVDFVRGEGGSADPNATDEQPVVTPPGASSPGTGPGTGHGTGPGTGPGTGADGARRPIPSERPLLSSPLPGPLAPRVSVQRGRGVPARASASTPPPAQVGEDGPRRRVLKMAIVTVLVLVLLAAAGAVGLAAARKSWYVGEKAGKLAIFQGVPGSFAGIRLSWLATGTDVATASLPAYAQERVSDGIRASNRHEAEKTVDNLRQQSLVLPGVAPTAPAGSLLTPAPPTATATVPGTPTTLAKPTPLARVVP